MCDYKYKRLKLNSGSMLCRFKIRVNLQKVFAFQKRKRFRAFTARNELRSSMRPFLPLSSCLFSLKDESRDAFSDVLNPLSLKLLLCEPLALPRTDRNERL